MEDAISQLQDLGVTRGEAKKALARYNNDVARAADFIFSGNLSSGDEEENTTESDEALAIRLSAEEEQAAKSYASVPETVEEEETDKPKIQLETVSPPPPPSPPQPTDPSTWSVIPFKAPDTSAPLTIPTSKKVPTESILTWWKDPEDPSDRIALDDL
ncbi:hypothetical protein BD770DRAFT_183560 [Pilaira anomala]|nr:hypothetical protein BD770DRAFT_183560 [Pilaira anomala]